MAEEVGSRVEKEIDNLNAGKEMKNLEKIEAALFISGKWMSMQELIELTDLNPLLMRDLIGKLTEKYDKSGAISILCKENRYKMDVKKEHADMVNKLATGSAEFTKAEQETLAVIAYKQPVKQSVLIKIRGNKAYEHVKKFANLGLLKAKKLGHTKELKLADEFYDYFHIRNRKSSEDNQNPINKGEFKAPEKKEKPEQKKKD